MTNNGQNGGETSATPQTVRSQTRTRKKRPLKMNSPSTPEAIERLERDLKCVQLRRSNMEWDAIAKQLGYADPGHAYQRFMAVMKSYPREDVDSAREVELQRYNQLLEAVWAICLDNDIDNKRQLWAIDRAQRLMDQRARLMGWNRPVRQEISVLTESTVDKAIQDLQAQMQAQAAAAGVELPAEVS